MYEPVLVVHSLLRWAALLLLLVALAQALRGWIGGTPWTAGNKRLGLFLVIAMDLQLVLGLLLYAVLSPITQAAFGQMGAAMKDKVLRFWAVEHLTMMVLAIVCVHVGHALAKRAATDLQKHKKGAIFFGLALLLVVAGIPWPGTAAGRGLVPGSAATTESAPVAP